MLALTLVLGAVVGVGSAAEARVVTVRFSHPDAAVVTAFRIYVREAGRSYGAPIYQGLPAPSSGVYEVPLTLADGITFHAVGTAVNSDGESPFSNELTFAPPAPVCGNALLETGEQCDDGNTSSGDGCSSTCRVERIPACGDAILDAGEQCDDGNTAAGDGCRADCSLEVCGDGRPDAGEQCDDGNTSPGDGCRTDCTIEACGDGRLDTGEQCDDGNTSSGDGCDAQCETETAPACGDGRLDEGEQCDDGNTTAGDGCDATCRTEAASLVPYRVNVGGSDYVDPAGQVWEVDAPYTDDGTRSSLTVQIRDTDADPMYRSRRYGTATGPPVTIQLPVDEEGLYTVRFHFAEVGAEVSGRGQRVFDVVVEDALSIPDLDVYALVGSRRALTRDLTVYVADGVITVRLVPKRGRPMLSGVEVHHAGELPTAPTPSAPRMCRGSCR